MHARLMGIVMTSAMALAAAGRIEAAPSNGTSDRDHFGVVLEVDGEFGGDNIAQVYYTNGVTQDIRAGQGVTLAVGAHYQPASLPLDFTATVGYKLVRTAAYNTNLGVDRVVVKFTGAYLLPNNFWVDAGPVWHTDVKFNGDGYVPDISFDDAIGGSVGAGWRWFGIEYTSIRYKSALTGTVDGSSVGATFAWKF
ncbi:MAG: hypothetical protein JWL65_4853 [Gammaproteobacteria bacterium]|jgi:hypothetical protein|nr:hypothetical protein [Gammaproteobacteria bacterium]